MIHATRSGISFARGWPGERRTPRFAGGGSMTRPVVALWLLVAALPAAAQPLTLAPPSIGDALRTMDRMRAVRSARGLADDAPPSSSRERLPQVFVLPERPGQNQVSWYDFEWHHVDVPSPSGGKGGIRLYFYGRERAVAELALPVIRAAYLRLVDQFHYTPTQQIPYILYASQREFQTTNVFDVSESVLGVTSPRDLKMSLPYFGDHRLFREVSTHELVHQFTIQKLLDLAGDEGPSPVEALPLWFVEGIAEYYSKGGLDPEADTYLRDLVWNPDPEHHYEVVSFPEDRYRGYIPTYKLGQARVAFVAEVYGKEKIQGFLENASVLTAGDETGDRGFGALTRRVLGEAPELVDARWREWLRRRYYPQYVKLRHDLPELRELRGLPAEPEAFATAPGGHVVLFRGLDRERARVKLFLMDTRYPRGAVEVAADSRPGIESLHPIEHSVMAIADGVLAFAAQSGPGDVLYIARYDHREPAGGKPPRLRLQERRELRLRAPSGRRFTEIWDPAFSPDARQIAFVGVTDTGQQDIYVVPADGGTARQLTDDPYSERNLAWGTRGIYCASDATDHGRFNLFAVDPDTGAKTRLTTGDEDDSSPAPLSDGSVLFASGAGGKTDLYLLEDGATRRITDFATGLAGPAVAADGRGIWASTFYRGRFRMVEVPRVAWLDEPRRLVASAAGPVLRIPREPLPGREERYDPFTLGNWHPEAGAVYGGGSEFGVAGSAAVLFTDMLRDRVVYTNLSVWGSFDYTQALALYEDRSQRTAWVVGAFHFVQPQLDRNDPNISFLQRDFGAIGTLRFPIDRFRRFEAEFTVGGVQRYCPTDYTVEQVLDCGGPAVTGDAAAAWERSNGGVTPQLGPTFRFGYDTVRYDLRAGPISGDAVLLELGGGWLPWRSAVHGFARVDAMKYLRLIGRSKLMFRIGSGTSFAPDETGRLWARTWWLTSADNLRGYGPFDLAYLTGRNYYVVNAELQLPLDPVIHLVLFDGLYAVAAMDFGGVFNRWSTVAGCTGSDPACTPRDLGAWDSRTLTGVLGVNAMFGPLLLRVHFGHPIDIDGTRTPAMRSGTQWVTNVTLRYFFF